MPSFTDRITGALSGVAARVEAIARAVRGPEESRVALVPHSTVHRPKPDQITLEMLRSWEVYSSRISPEAGPTKDRYSLWPGDSLTPERIIGAQREAVTSGIPLRWVELIDQAYSRDGHYSGVTLQRVQDVTKGRWRLTRNGTDNSATASRNFAEEAYRNCSRWRDGMGWLLMSNLYCYSSFEVEWCEDSITFSGPKGEVIGPVDVALPRRLHNVHPKHFRFDLDTDDPLFWIRDAYQPLPWGKFVFLDGEGLHPTKVRHGHAWQSIWYSFFRSIGWAGWAVFVDRFGMPVPMIEYEGTIDQFDEFQAAYQSILNSLGSGKGAIFPRNGARFEIKDPPRGGGERDPHSALSAACDAGQTIRVLGAELVTSVGNIGSHGAMSGHLSVKYAKEEDDAGRMWERIDEQLTAPLIYFNAIPLAKALNEAGYPEITPDSLCRRVPRGKHRVPRESDPLVEMQIADYAANKLGLPLSVEGMFDQMDFPRALSEQDTVKGEAQQVSRGGALVGGVEASNKGAEAPPDETLAGDKPVPPKSTEPARDEKDADKFTRLEQRLDRLVELWDARNSAVV